jgi:hypothetical protein
MRVQVLVLAIVVFSAAVARPTSAQTPGDDGFVVWDQSIASAVTAGLPDEDRCGASPYALYGPRCRHQLNLSFDRPIFFLTFLDKIAILAYKYHKLNYKQNLWDNTKLKFEVNLKNVYKQEAQARLELRYRFSSVIPDLWPFSGPGAVALPHPSFYEN